MALLSGASCDRRAQPEERERRAQHQRRDGNAPSTVSTCSVRFGLCAVLAAVCAARSSPPPLPRAGSPPSPFERRPSSRAAGQHGSCVAAAGPNLIIHLNGKQTNEHAKAAALAGLHKTALLDTNQDYWLPICCNRPPKRRRSVHWPVACRSSVQLVGLVGLVAAAAPHKPGHLDTVCRLPTHPPPFVCPKSEAAFSRRRWRGRGRSEAATE